MTKIVSLTAAEGIAASITGHGAAIASITVPAAGRRVETVLGYTDADAYASDEFFMGATIGRYANRIRDGRLRLGNCVYELECRPEDVGHCLHGGPQGFHRHYWSHDLAPAQDAVCCRYISEHGEGGFPGRLDVAVTYRLINGNALSIDVEATSDRATVVNIANHAYFNLNGDRSSIDNHRLKLNARQYTPVDEALIPTGKIEEVAGSRFDFTRYKELSGNVLDTNFVLIKGDDDLSLAASLYSPQTRVRLNVHTTQPGLQVYTGDYLAPPFARRTGICLEAQNFPDAPNWPHFPSAELPAGEVYKHRTIYEFEVVPI